MLRNNILRTELSSAFDLVSLVMSCSRIENPEAQRCTPSTEPCEGSTTQMTEHAFTLPNMVWLTYWWTRALHVLEGSLIVYRLLMRTSMLRPSDRPADGVAVKNTNAEHPAPQPQSSENLHTTYTRRRLWE